MTATITSITARRRPPLDHVILTPFETAKALGVRLQTLHRWDESGKLPAVFRTPGGHRRWRKADVDALLAGQS